MSQTLIVLSSELPTGNKTCSYRYVPYTHTQPHWHTHTYNMCSNYISKCQMLMSKLTLLINAHQTPRGYTRQLTNNQVHPGMEHYTGNIVVVTPARVHLPGLCICKAKSKSLRFYWLLYSNIYHSFSTT